MHMGDISNNNLYSKRRCYKFVYLLANGLPIELQVGNSFVLVLQLGKTTLVESLIELYIEQS